MALVQSTLGPTQSTTKVTGSQYVPPAPIVMPAAQPFALAPEFAALLDQERRDRAQALARMYSAEHPAMTLGAGPSPASSSPMSHGGGAPAPQEGNQQAAQLQAMQLQALKQRLLEDKQATAAPPLMMTPGGFNMMPHYELDTVHMTPAQRAAFLPKGQASVQAGPSDAGSDARGLYAYNVATKQAEDAAAQKAARGY